MPDPWSLAGPAAPPEPFTAAAFRRLCRSSPWRWESLRFRVEWRAAGAGAAAPLAVRAWLRRPGALRVEDDGGRLLFRTTGINDSRGSFYASGTRAAWLLPPRLSAPVYDDDSLVRRRPEAAYGDPVFADPRWAALLDPVELAGSGPAPAGSPFAAPAAIDSLERTVHAGRPAVAAVLVPNRAYAPATPGSPLLGPGRNRVVVDWRTAVCVVAEELDGPFAGRGHEVRIEGVDEYMLDDLFVGDPVHLTDVREHIPWDTGQARGGR